jgi:putative thioredoxin
VVLADRIAGIEYGELVEAIRITAHLSEYARSTHTEPLAAGHGLYLEGIERLFAGKYAAALEKFIEAIKRNRKLDDDGARKACVAIFKILGEDHPVTLNYRREFANALY